MIDMADADFDRALERGSRLHQLEPRAVSARYDASIDRIVLVLSNGCSFLFPPSLGQGLEIASADHLAQVEILGAGTGLHWEALDVDLSVVGLINGLFGTQAHMAALGGRQTSPAKAAAARANGAKGGRPRKAG